MFTDSFLPYCSGVTFAVMNQARELADRGHEVSIFRPRPKRSSPQEKIELPDSVRIYDVPIAVSVPRIPNLRIALPALIPSVSRIRRLRPEVVHVSSEWGCGWEGLASSRLLGIPVVGTFHTFFADPGYLKSFGLPNWRAIRALMWKYSIFFYNRCRAVISPSKAVRDALLSNGIKNDPRIISNGIQEPPLQTPSAIADMRAKYALDGPSFIYVGRLSPEKSMHVLLNAFRAVADQHQKARLVVVGDGPSRADMDRRVQELSLQQHVIQLGHIPHDKLIGDNLPLLGDVFVTASTTENQPLSILEAMSFGLPVVGARAKGIPELVAEDENGLLFEPDDVAQMARCMMRLVEDRELRRRMSDASKTYASEHTLSRVVDKLEAVYEEAISPVSNGALSA